MQTCNFLMHFYSKSYGLYQFHEPWNAKNQQIFVLWCLWILYAVYFDNIARCSQDWLVPLFWIGSSLGCEKVSEFLQGIFVDACWILVEEPEKKHPVLVLIAFSHTVLYVHFTDSCKMVRWILFVHHVPDLRSSYIGIYFYALCISSVLMCIVFHGELNWIVCNDNVQCFFLCPQWFLHNNILAISSQS